jgi:hypothetical protein
LLALNTSAVGDFLCAFTVGNGGNASCRKEKTQTEKEVSSIRLGILVLFTAEYQPPRIGS